MFRHSNLHNRTHPLEFHNLVGDDRKAEMAFMRIGFLVWNEFQFYHFRSVLEELPEATLFIDVRTGFHRRFPFGVLKGLKNRFITLHNSDLRPISALADVLVVQSHTLAKIQLPQVRIVAMQYSLSKEWHQYGSWMQEADLVLCFGEYSRSRIETRAPVHAVGNPRMDAYFADQLDDRILARMRHGLDPKKPTMMLAPSWSNPHMTAQLKAMRRMLSSQFNVLWSPHHNTRIFGNRLLGFLTRNTLSFDRYLYCLKLSDILVSDTSGSLFDAIHAGKHVIIADFERDQPGNQESIEFQMRDKIGPVAADATELGTLGKRLISGDLNFTQANTALRKACFCCDGEAARNTVKVLRAAFGNG